MMHIITILFPVFGLIVFGGWLRHVGFLTKQMEMELNRFVYFIALPTFITHKIATSPGVDLSAFSSILAMLMTTGTVWLLGIALAPVFRSPKRSLGTFSQLGFRGNLAYVGIPVIVNALSDQPVDLQNAVAAEAMLVIGSTVLLYNLLGVIGLEWDRRHEHENNPWRKCLGSIAKNPLLLACVAGLLWNGLSIPMPNVLTRMAQPVGSTAFPVALIAIGSRIRSLQLHHFGLPLLGVIFLKNAICLGVGYGMCQILGIQGGSQVIVLVLSACPSAVATYVLVDQLNGDRELAASSIAVTAVVSIVGLSVALFLAL